MVSKQVVYAIIKEIIRSPKTISRSRTRHHKLKKEHGLVILKKRNIRSYGKTGSGAASYIG